MHGCVHYAQVRLNLKQNYALQIGHFACVQWGATDLFTIQIWSRYFILLLSILKKYYLLHLSKHIINSFVIKLVYQCPPYAAASGSADGAVRLWDLMTGTCTHKFKWHTEAVVSLATSLQFIVSLGLDDRMCIWERTRNQMLHKIAMVNVC